MTDSLRAVREDVVACTRCARLVEWRNEAAHEPPARYTGQRYWAKPLPGFGDPNARLVVVGRPPGPHGRERPDRPASSPAIARATGSSGRFIARGTRASPRPSRATTA